MKIFRIHFVALTLVCSANPAWTQSRFTVSADATEVTDGRSKLVWSRCLVGMSMKANRCQGQPISLPFVLVSGKVKEINGAEGKVWRLPTMRELLAIAAPMNADATSNLAAIDRKAFPDSPVSRVWTSGTTGRHYHNYINFLDGDTGEQSDNMPATLRLVREP